MVTMVQQLEQIGIQVGKQVGFLVLDGSETVGWKLNHAKIGRILLSIPKEAEDLEELQDFDPEYDLLVIWQIGTAQHFYVLRVTNGSNILIIKDCGLAIIKKDRKIHIGQSDEFMDTVCGLVAALYQP
jgi:hypothetical protein